MGKVVLFLSPEQRRFRAEVNENMRCLKRYPVDDRKRYIQSVIRRYGAMQERDRGKMLLRALEHDLMDALDD